MARIVLCIAVLLAFGASLTHGFHFDDYSVVYGPDWNLWRARPLTWLSFWVSSKISAYPPSWHLVSVVGHVLVCAVIYLLAKQFMSAQAAIFSALVFAIHPIQTESVAYVFSRSTILASLAALLSWYFILRDRKVVAILLFAVALSFKEDCATLPLVILLFDQVRSRKTLIPVGIMLLLSVVAAIHTLALTTELHGSGAGFSAGISPASYLFKQGYVVTRYLVLVAVPYGYTIDPEIDPATAVSILAWILLAALVFAAIWKKQRWFLAGLILLIPSSSIFPLADLAADHRMYLPMTVFAGLIGLALTRVPRAFSVAVLVALLLVTAARMNVWADDSKLWAEAVNRAPDKLRPRLQLARALPASQAIVELDDTDKRFGDRWETHQEKGRVYLTMAQPAMALSEFGAVLAQRPDDAHAIYNRGVALLALGQENAAKQDFNRALAHDPCLEEARNALGMERCR